MHIIYLSGNSLNNKTWIETVKSNLDSFSTGDILYYTHWQTGEKFLNFDIESQKLSDLVKGQDNYCIFSKSVGSILALKSIHEKILNPQKIIICGHPYNLAKELKLPIDDYLKSLAIPVIFIQNEFDPLFSHNELEKVLKENNPANYQLIKNPDNSTHDYLDLKNLATITKQFFEDQQLHLKKINKTLNFVAKQFLGKIVTVKIDRPLGTKHPKHGFEYKSNYGFIPGTKAPDGEELDAYVLKVKKPLKKFTGNVIAIIHRTNDDDDKLIVIPKNKNITNEEIENATEFQEKWFKHVIVRPAF